MYSLESRSRQLSTYKKIDLSHLFLLNVKLYHFLGDPPFKTLNKRLLNGVFIKRTDMRIGKQ